MSPTMAFFGYAVTDLDRSRKFYEEVLGLTPTLITGGGAFVEYDLGTTTLAIGKAPGFEPGKDGAAVALEVDDLAIFTERLKRAGVAIAHENVDSGVCNMTLITDPDGNGICIHKRKPEKGGTTPAPGTQGRVEEIAFVGYPVTDMARAREFYEGALGLELAEYDREAPGEHWMEYALGKETLAVVKAFPDWQPASKGNCVALEVDNFAKSIDKLKSKGIAFLMEPTEMPGCHMAIVTDPDQNRVLIHKLKAQEASH